MKNIINSISFTNLSEQITKKCIAKNNVRLRPSLVCELVCDNGCTFLLSRHKQICGSERYGQAMYQVTAVGWSDFGKKIMLHFLYTVVPNCCSTPIPKFLVLMLPFHFVAGHQ